MSETPIRLLAVPPNWKDTLAAAERLLAALPDAAEARQVVEGLKALQAMPEAELPPRRSMAQSIDISWMTGWADCRIDFIKRVGDLVSKALRAASDALLPAPATPHVFTVFHDAEGVLSLEVTAWALHTNQDVLSAHAAHGWRALTSAAEHERDQPFPAKAVLKVLKESRPQCWARVYAAAQDIQVELAQSGPSAGLWQWQGRLPINQAIKLLDQSDQAAALRVSSGHGTYLDAVLDAEGALAELLKA